MSDLPTLYRTNGELTGWEGDDLQRLIDDGALVPVTEALLTREEAANDPEVRKAVLSTADLDAAAEVMTQLTAEDLPAVTWHRAASRAVLRAALEVTDDE